MHNSLLISLPGNTELTMALAKQLEMEIGQLEIRHFPDTETYIRVDSDVQNKNIILVCGLEYPNSKILPLMFLIHTLKELGANKICLISPYLPYMRQDKRFKSGEAITSSLFAKYLSPGIDYLITIDPHLHRIQNLSDIYTIPSITVLHATTIIANWIQDNVESPFIIGPDEESRQWVAEVANKTKAPFEIIKKTRLEDEKVTIILPEINDTKRTPVLVDDIISTGGSMRAATRALILKGFKKPICIGIHALFNTTTYDHLMQDGAEKIITCNTINHPTNKIDITDMIVREVRRLQL